MIPVTLAITTFNRFDLVVKSFEQVLDDPRISEIVISDDASDLAIYNQLTNHFQYADKVRIHRNLTNQGVYRNKYTSVVLAHSDWVIVFDSDNIIGKDYLDALYAAGWDSGWDAKTVYCPEFAKPKFDYRHFSGKTIDRSNAASFFKEKQFDCLINTMNCFVNREEYLKYYDPETEPAAADSAYFNFRWLTAGNKMLVVEGLQYEHLVHAGSHYVQNIGRSNAFHSKMMNAFKTMT